MFQKCDITLQKQPPSVCHSLAQKSKDPHPPPLSDVICEWSHRPSSRHVLRGDSRITPHKGGGKCIHMQYIFMEIVGEFAKRAVCSYWSTRTKDDSSFFVLGSLLSKFAEKLNYSQLLSFTREFTYVLKGQKAFQ